MKEIIIEIIKSKAQGGFHLEIDEPDLEVIADEILLLLGVENCVENCTDFKNIESLLFDFWETLRNDVDCINSENIVGKISSFCKTLK